MTAHLFVCSPGLSSHQKRNQLIPLLGPCRRRLSLVFFARIVQFPSELVLLSAFARAWGCRRSSLWQFDQVLFFYHLPSLRQNQHCLSVVGFSWWVPVPFDVG